MVFLEVHQASGIVFLNMKVAQNGVVLEDAVFSSYFMLRYNITIKTTEPKAFSTCRYTMYVSIICLNLFLCYFSF